jgi:hypothetical protein
MAISNSRTVTIDTVDGCSVVEKISSDTYFPSTDTEFPMKDNSRVSSRMSATEPIEDVVDVEEKQFRWSTISIREYAYALGDGVTSTGPPICLSWEHQDETVFDLLQYDQACVEGETRRTQTELKMPSKHRAQILKESGYSQKRIQEAIKNANVTRNQRKKTNRTHNLQPFQEALEKVRRGATKPMRRKDAHLKNYKA